MADCKATNINMSYYNQLDYGITCIFFFFSEESKAQRTTGLV